MVFVFSVSLQVLSVSGRSPLDAATPATELIKIRVKYRHASHAEREKGKKRENDGNEHVLLHRTAHYTYAFPLYNSSLTEGP